ncbi:MAG: MATE family efflux transporter [Spirochaetia bacterium]|jgi:putative MATE family efflux protein|uniref:Multidrug-efflux transporter n=1 Tax=uncultured spirochete TaxID=156406 RepID=A0A3P3XK89_9SPIR|nr:MATE family efflux transporter [Rectinema subterraneum]MDQ7796087.1 MATE family efflux transporter [Spirochaetia bacterium]SLM14487.1 MATE efflux family protein [uncultured spirochete]
MKDLTKGDEATTLITFALPMLLGNVFQQFYNMVDSFVVGRFVGTNALAAVGVAFPVIFLLVALIMGITMGSSVLISQFFGARDRERLASTISTSYIFLFGAGIFMSVLGFFSVPFILNILAVPPEIYAEARSYMSIILGGMLITFGYNGVSAMLRGVGDSKTPLYLLVAASLMNVVLDLVFVIVFHWGVAGAAWATLISQAFSFITAMVIFNRTESHMKVELKKLSWNKEIFGSMIKIGLPTGIQQTLVSLGMMMLTRIVNEFGPATMAAYTAAARIDSFASMPAMNLSQALMTFTGQNMGAGKTERVKKGHRAAIIMNIVISLSITLLVTLAGHWLIGIFTTDGAVIDIGARYLLIVGFFYIIFGTMFINNGVMRGAGDVFIPMISSLLALWIVRIPCALLFTKVFGMGSDGIWWSIPAGWFVGFVFTTWYYRTGKWKTKVLVRRPPLAEEIE